MLRRPLAMTAFLLTFLRFGLFTCPVAGQEGEEKQGQRRSR